MATKHLYGKICKTLDELHVLWPKVLHENRAYIHRLLGEGVFFATDYLLSGMFTTVRDTPMDEDLFAEFRSYDDAEEARIQRTLEELDHNLDAPNTLTLIVRPGNFEKVILLGSIPYSALILFDQCMLLVLHRILEECLKRCQYAAERPVSKHELLPLRHSLWTILRSVYDRVDDIRGSSNLSNLRVVPGSNNSSLRLNGHRRSPWQQVQYN